MDEEDYQEYVPIKPRKQARLRNIPTTTAEESGPVSTSVDESAGDKSLSDESEAI